MVQEIIRDKFFLRLPSVSATVDDLQVAQNLLDTLAANSHRCGGLAANMIGVSKRIIVVNDEGTPNGGMQYQINKYSRDYPFRTFRGLYSMVLGDRLYSW